MSFQPVSSSAQLRARHAHGAGVSPGQLLRVGVIATLAALSLAAAGLVHGDAQTGRSVSVASLPGAHTLPGAH